MKKMIITLFLPLILTQFTDAQMSFVKSDIEFSNYDDKALPPYKKRRRKSKRFKKQLYLGLGLGGGFFTDFYNDPSGSLGFHLNAIYHNRPKAVIEFSFYINSFKDEYAWGSSKYSSREEYNVRLMSFQVHKLLLFGKKRLRPYIGAGGGFALEYLNGEMIKLTIDNTNNNPPTETRKEIKGIGGINLSISPSAGFVADLSDNIQLNFNTRFTYGWEPDWEYWQLNSSLAVLFRLPKSDKSKKKKKKSSSLKKQFWMGSGAEIVLGLGGKFISGAGGNFNMLYFHRPKGCFGLNMEIISSGYQNSFPQGAGYKIDLITNEPKELNESDKDNFNFRFVNIAIQRMFFIGNRKAKPYIGIEWGFTVVKIRLDDPTDVCSLNSYTPVFLFAGSRAGVMVPVAKRVNLNINARYSNTNSNRQGSYPLLTVNFGVMFNLSKL